MVFTPQNPRDTPIHQTRTGLREFSPSQTQWNILSLYLAGAPLSYLQEVMHLGHLPWKTLYCYFLKSPAFHSPDQLKGITDPWILFTSWALVTFMSCLAICWKMLLAMMPKALLICAWKKRYHDLWGSAGPERDQRGASVSALNQVNLGLTLSERPSDLE